MALVSNYSPGNKPYNDEKAIYKRVVGVIGNNLFVQHGYGLFKFQQRNGLYPAFKPVFSC